MQTWCGSGQGQLPDPGQEHGKRTPVVAAAAGPLSPEQLRALEAGEPAAIQLDGEVVTFEPDDLAIEREVTSEWLVQSSGPYVVALDPQLDDSLRREGFAREVVSRIQRLRREAGYTSRRAFTLGGRRSRRRSTRCAPTATASSEETLAQCLEIGARARMPDAEQQLEIDGLAVMVGVRRSDEPATVAAP